MHTLTFIVLCTLTVYTAVAALQYECNCCMIIATTGSIIVYKNPLVTETDLYTGLLNSCADPYTGCASADCLAITTMFRGDFTAGAMSHGTPSYVCTNSIRLCDGITATNYSCPAWIVFDEAGQALEVGPPACNTSYYPLVGLNAGANIVITNTPSASDPTIAVISSPLFTGNTTVMGTLIGNTGTFNGTVSGADPTTGANFATKNYVDTQASGNVSSLAAGVGTYISGTASVPIVNTYVPSVKDYGAKGDGSTDDTDAFVAALSSNAKVYVPASTNGYLLTRPLTIPVNKTLFGVNPTGSYLVPASNYGNVIEMTAGATLQGIGITASSLASFTFAAISIFGGTFASVISFPLLTSIRDVALYGTHGYGYGIEFHCNDTNQWISFVNVENAVIDDFSIGVYLLAPEFGVQTYVNANTFDQIIVSGITNASFYLSGGSVASQVQGNTFTNIQVEGGPIGIILQGITPNNQLHGMLFDIVGTAVQLSNQAIYNIINVGVLAAQISDAGLGNMYPGSNLHSWANNTLSLSTGAYPDSRVLVLQYVASAVNYFSFTPSITGSGVRFSSAGTDSNVALFVQSQGTASVYIQPGTSGGVTNSEFKYVASAVNGFVFTPAVTGSAPRFFFWGSDTDVSGFIQSKGTGNIYIQPGAGGGVACAQFQYIASAVNYLIVQGGTTGNSVNLISWGSDTNVTLSVKTKGSADIKLNPGGNVLIGSGSAIATSAITGFLALPTCAGAPTGVPTGAGAGYAPMIVDSTNLKIWIYVAGAWHFVALT